MMENGHSFGWICGKDLDEKDVIYLFSGHRDENGNFKNLLLKEKKSTGEAKI